MTRPTLLVAAALGVALLLVVGVIGWLLPPTDETLVSQALEAAQAGRAAPAISATIRRIRGKPAFADTRLLLEGAMHVQAGDGQAALAVFAELRPEGPLRRPLLVLTGQALYRVGNLSRAELCFREVLHEQPDHAVAQRWLAGIYFDLGAMDAALAELQKLIDRDPQDFAAHRLRGLIYVDFERYAEAIPALQAALPLAREPGARDEVGLVLARALIAQRRYTDAESLLSTLPVSADKALALAECAVQQGDFQAASGQLDWLEKRYSTDPRAARIRGNLAFQQGQYEAAVEPLRAALTADPHDLESRYRLAMAYRHLGQREAADAELARHAEIQTLRQDLNRLNVQAIQQPQNAEVRLAIANLCDQLHLPALAARWRQAAAHCVPIGPGP